MASSLDATIFGWRLRGDHFESDQCLNFNRHFEKIAKASSDFNHLPESISDLSPVVRVGKCAPTSGQWNEEKVECLKKAQELCLMYSGSKCEH